MLLPLLLALLPGERVVLDAPEGARQPQLAVAADGKVAVVFGVKGEIHLSLSSDSGATFAAPLKVADAGKLALGMRRGPRVAFAGEAIVVTAIAGEKGGGRDGDVLAWRSTDEGRTWSGSVRVNDVAASAREGLHAMASDGQVRVFCTWVDLREPRAAVVYLSESPDAGATWSEDRLVYRSPSGTICECCAPSLAVDGNSVHVMFRNALEGDRDMWLVSSPSGGKTFADGRKLGAGAWKIATCPMDGGALVSDAKGVRAVWRRDRELFLSVPGLPETRLGEGVQPWMAIGPAGDYIAWTQKRGGTLMMLAPGAGKAIALEEVANDAVIVSAPGAKGPVIAAWESGKGKDVKLVVMRLDGPR